CGGDHAFRRAAGSHDCLHARAFDSSGDAGREIAIADEADARARLANVIDQLLVTRAAEHDTNEIFHVTIHGFGDLAEVFNRRSVEAHAALAERSDDDLLHVAVWGVQQSAFFRNGE